MTKINIEKLAKENGATLGFIGGEPAHETNRTYTFTRNEMTQLCEAYHQIMCEQSEPVAWMHKEIKSGLFEKPMSSPEQFTPLYTTPPDQFKLIESQAREIAELKSELKVTDKLYKDACETQYNFGELQAHINQLREALEFIENHVPEDSAFAVLIRQSIATTPAQSLQAHDDEVIERCANVADTIFNDKESHTGQQIRALKDETNHD